MQRAEANLNFKRVSGSSQGFSVEIAHSETAFAYHSGSIVILPAGGGTYSVYNKLK
jgi:hypothetical protein